MQTPRLIKRIIIEYTEEESEDSSTRYRIHKKTIEERYLTGTEWADNPLVSTRSEYLV